MSLALEETIRLPPGFANLEVFRRWTRSDAYPQRGEFAYLGGDLWVDLSMETLLHNELKLKIVAALSLLVVDPERLGRVFTDGMRLVNVAANLSLEPDGMFVSRQAFESGRVILEQGAQSLELIGAPEMVLEVVSPSSVQKDTVVLPELYAAAGIAEYWLVNPIGGHLAFDILELAENRYTPAKKSDGWVNSSVFGKSFQLVRENVGSDLPEFRLLVRSLS